MAPPRHADVCIVGFGYAGLATLAEFVARGAARRIAVVDPDPTGLGAAYSTRNPAHLLNVRAERMGALAAGAGDFARWLESAAGRAACASAGVDPLGPLDFAPRMIYGRYLAELRDATRARARARGIEVDIRPTLVTRLHRDPDGFTLTTADGAQIAARACVLAVGSASRKVLEGATVERGARLTGSVAGSGGGDIAALVVGTGLSAVDAIISLRTEGVEGEIVAVSRNGLMPRAHSEQQQHHTFPPERLARVRCAADARDLLEETVAAGGDWLLVMEGVRSHTQAIWRQFPPAAQREAIAEYGALWKAHRHRMAPEIAARIDVEQTAGTLRVLAGRVASSPGERCSVAVTRPDGSVETFRPARLVDCSGAELDWRRGGSPLLTGLVEDGICAPHHTGLGVCADSAHRAAPELFVLGSALTGELWESVAVPELREQAATIAAAARAMQPVAA